MDAYLIYDLGTGNSRVALVSPNGNIIGIKRFDNTYFSDDVAASARYADNSL